MLRRHLPRLSLVVALGAGALVALLVASGRARLVSAAPPPEAKAPGKYLGTKACNGSGCHERAEPRETPPYLQEYATWSAPPADPRGLVPFDRHSFAYERLRDDVSAAIMKKLNALEKTEAKAEESGRCLTCHGVAVHDYGVGARNPGLAVGLEGSLKGPKYVPEEGVSCDGCHGPAEKWKDPHTAKEWATREREKRGGAKDAAAASRKLYDELGIYYSKDLELWAGQCVRCHLTIDTHLIDADHPDLVPFELYGQSEAIRVARPEGAAATAHWRDYADAAPDRADLPGPGKLHAARAWQTGQAAALHAAATQLARRAASEAGSPDHNPDAKRRTEHVVAAFERLRGHFVVFRHALAKLEPELAKKLEARVLGEKGLASLVAAGKHDEVAKVAAEVAGLLKKPGEPASLARRAADAKLAPADVKATLRAIANDPEAIDRPRARQQAALGLHALYTAYRRAEPVPDDPVAGYVAAMGGVGDREPGQVWCWAHPYEAGGEAGAACARCGAALADWFAEGLRELKAALK